MIDFGQVIGNTEVYFGIGPINKTNDSSWVVTSLGAVVHNENGKHVIYAPGETVDLGSGITFIVKPVMDEEELQALQVGAALRRFSNDPALDKIAANKNGPPIVGLLIILGLPLALISGIIYGIFRFLRRRRGALPDLHIPLQAPDGPSEK